MTDRPILFSGPMVRALLDGRKTMTRRLIRTDERGRCVRGRYAAFMRDGIGMVWRPYGGSDEVAMPSDHMWEMVGYAPGDRLWVRETWQVRGLAFGRPISETRIAAPSAWHYRATDDGAWKAYWGKWRPGIHMPRWASRLTLTVSDVRVQRLLEISEEDAIAEGVDAVCMADMPRQASWSRKQDFAQLWDHINGKREGVSWDDNPWVVAISFTVAKRNIDACEESEAAA